MSEPPTEAQLAKARHMNAVLTPEQRSAAGQKGAAAKWAKERQEETDDPAAPQDVIYFASHFLNSPRPATCGRAKKAIFEAMEVILERNRLILSGVRVVKEQAGEET
jgi:hypothetical protein